MSAAPARCSRRWIWIPVGILVAIVAVVVVAALVGGSAGPWRWGFFPWFPFVGLWIFLWIFLLFWAARGCGGPWAWGSWRAGAWNQSGSILRERYARGEITKEELDRMTKDLEERA